jgi:hypothetical protein
VHSAEESPSLSTSRTQKSYSNTTSFSSSRSDASAQLKSEQLKLRMKELRCIQAQPLPAGQESARYDGLYFALQNTVGCKCRCRPGPFRPGHQHLLNATNREAPPAASASCQVPQDG